MTTSGERAKAGGHWLLSAAPSTEQSYGRWTTMGAAWLRPGALFGAVLVPADVVHGAVGLDDPVTCAAPLAEALEGGPVFFTRVGFRDGGCYTALVPASAAQTWRVAGATVHHHRALLLVPAPHVIEPQEEDCPWWVVPLDGPGLLCPPDRLGDLVALGRDATRKPTGEEGGGDA
ncbi:hypothetical protein V1J52_06985 [Streptomyces sp. TRM 70351]|uniref:hypothetical protein n=1 Tax=Streptomyces sp. TRM 70351 TaxID=3116552 RepID=UPI002E7C2835|nr:hypothetical protein [Streptomyces sp. TRM 70351]MEE1927940.1 hypothetical protein [Streptomyces sp. TRM 70351]